MLKQLTVQKAYESERKFTEMMSRNTDWLDQVMEVCGLSQVVKADAEVQTIEGKRIDIVCETMNEGVVVIEHQDCSGWLDANHVGKSFMYALDKDSEHNILMCEDVSANLKDNIRKMNLHPSFSTYVVKTQLFQTGDGGIHFVPVLLEGPSEKARTNSAKKTIKDNDEINAWLDKVIPFMESKGFMHNIRYKSHVDCHFDTPEKMGIDHRFETPYFCLDHKSISIYVNQEKAIDAQERYMELAEHLHEDGISAGTGKVWKRIFLKVSDYDFAGFEVAIDRLLPILKKVCITKPVTE